MNSTRNVLLVLCTLAVLTLMSLMVDYIVDPAEQDELATPQKNTFATHEVSSKAHEEDSDSFPPRRAFFAWTPLPATEYRAREEWSHVPTHASFVRINDRIDHWLLGTPLEILIPQTNRTFHAKVDAIKPNAANSMTILASPDKHEHDLQRFILTYGSDHVLGYLTTQTNNWEINGDGQVAWIVSGQKLNRSKDYSKEDVIHREVYRYANAEYLPKRKE